MSGPAGTRRCDNVGFWLSFGRDVGQRRSNVTTSLCQPGGYLLLALSTVNALQ